MVRTEKKRFFGNPLPPETFFSGNGLKSARGHELTAGDPDQVARVINLLRPHLKQLSKSLLPGWKSTKADDSDVAQESMTRAIVAFHQFKGDSPEQFWAWLVAIQRNEVNRLLERFAAAPREMMHEQPLHNTPELPGGRSPEVELSQRENAELRAKVLATLRKDDQAIIRLRLFEQRVYKEIALLMNREYEAVKKLHMRAIARWRHGCDQLGDKGSLSE